MYNKTHYKLRESEYYKLLTINIGVVVHLLKTSPVLILLDEVGAYILLELILKI